MATLTVPAREIRPGDVILAESPRYHGPTFTVDTVSSAPYIVRPHNGPMLRIEGHYGTGNGLPHSATLSSVPPNKPYMVERAS